MIPNRDGVIVSPTEPETDRRKVWFQKGKNAIDISYTKEETTIDASTGVDVYHIASCCGENYIEVSPNTTYTISTNKSLAAIRLSEYADKKVHIQRNQSLNSDSLTITTTETTKYLKWSLNIDNVNASTLEKVQSLELQLEQGTERTEYELYVDSCMYVKNDNGKYEEFIKKEEQTKSIINSNGTAIKFPDGAMICTKRINLTNINVNTVNGSLYTTSAINLGNFAVNFIDVPTVNFTLYNSAAGFIYKHDNFSKTSVGAITIARNSSVTNTYYNIAITAIGHWK